MGHGLANPCSFQREPAHYFGYVYFRQVKDRSVKRGYFQKVRCLVTLGWRLREAGAGRQQEGTVGRARGPEPPAVPTPPAAPPGLCPALLAAPSALSLPGVAPKALMSWSRTFLPLTDGWRVMSGSGQPSLEAIGRE